MGGAKFLCTIFAFAIFAGAQDLCVQLCEQCSANAENPTCQNVNEVCGNCTFILDSLEKQHIQDSLAGIALSDSLKKEKFRLDSLHNLDVRKLGEIILSNCKNDTCNFEIVIKKDRLNQIRALKKNKTKKIIEQKKQNRQDDWLPPMSEECKNFCGICVDKEHLSIDTTNSICEKIETQCSCIAQMKQERSISELARTDSILAVEKSLELMKTSQITSSEIFDFCSFEEVSSNCSLSVKIIGENLKIAEILDQESKKIQKNDAILKDSKRKKNNSFNKDSTDNSDIHPNPYMGFSIAYEQFSEREIAYYEVYSSSQWGIDLGFLFRLYFYQWGSFQTGVNLVFHHGEYDIDEEELYSNELGSGYGGITHSDLMLEFPLSLRTGFPLGKSKVNPFVSLNLFVQKPMYVWMDYHARWSYNYEFDTFYDDFYALQDWAFLLYFGIGLELSRHVVLHWQIYLYSIVTYTDTIDNYRHSDDGTWRLSFEYAW